MIDLIGDIHGHADKLEELLLKMGYAKSKDGYSHPDRKVLFVGDYIDRGGKIRETLQIVKAMVDNENAIALMGNHEYNFIAYRTQDDEGKRLRLNTTGHRAQIAQTLQSFEEHDEEIPGWIEWMKGLPFFLDLGDLRVVHASWVPGDIAYLADKSLLDRDFLIESARRGSSAW
jgi:predicted MPP superfamily phosphohydrolase